MGVQYLGVNQEEVLPCSPYRTQSGRSTSILFFDMLQGNIPIEGDGEIAKAEPNIYQPMSIGEGLFVL